MADNPLLTHFSDFPVPRLDDRTMADLMEEMRALIPIYCPEWTNHNPSDPGITLLELFAWLTEVMLYRLNRVPVKNLFALLDLLGIQPQPPAPARAQLVVTPNGGAEGRILPRGTQITSERQGEDAPIVFETERDLPLTTVRILHAFARDGERFEDVTAALGRRPFAPFHGATAAECLLYVRDPRLSSLAEEGLRTHLRFEGPSAHRDLYARWRWERFDGVEWAPARLAVAHGRGEVVLLGGGSSAMTTVDGTLGHWLRAAHLPHEEPAESIALTDVLIEVESEEQGILPDAVFLNPGGDVVFTRLDTSRVFHPLGERPALESTVYILSQALLGTPGTRVELAFITPDPGAWPRPELSPDLTLRLEYATVGGRWGLIGALSSGVLATAEGQGDILEDSTRALRRTGAIHFTVPPDILSREIQGQRGPWIRLRLVKGSFIDKDAGAPPGAMAQQAPPPGPAFESLVLRARAPARPAAEVRAHRDFTFQTLLAPGVPRLAPVHPFQTSADYDRALYIGLSEAPDNRRLSLYIKTQGGSTPSPDPLQRIRWEARGEGGFERLRGVEDETAHLDRDGYVRAELPDAPQRTLLFGHEAFWLRARLVEGAYDSAPRLLDLRLNSVPVLNQETRPVSQHHDSDGMPNQELRLGHSPIIGEVSVWVRETEPPRSDALREPPGEGEVMERGGERFSRWRPVPHFVDAGPQSRVYRLDPHNGVIRFGDGRAGKVPPPGRRGIQIDALVVGGGIRGNVGPHTLTVLRESNSWVAAVTNPDPADGGSQAEDLKTAADRGIRRMYKADRAWSVQDYADLARAASGRVARVICLEPRGQGRLLARRGARAERPADRGPVEVIILPHRRPGERGGERLTPSSELLRRVEAYLEPRRVLGARVQVRGPRYRPFRVSCRVYLRGRSAEAPEAALAALLRRYLDPLQGGDGGGGWALGGAVRPTALFQLLSGSPLVLSVRDLSLMTPEGALLPGPLTLARDELPELASLILNAEVLQ